jgi:hypothetical protein
LVARPVDRQFLLFEVWGHNAAMTIHTPETQHLPLTAIEANPADPLLLMTEQWGLLA